jgi:hypothetical protein
VNPSGMSHALRMRALPSVMSELFSILPVWFYILLAVGVFDALLQWADYRQWRKDRGESENASE